MKKHPASKAPASADRLGLLPIPSSEQRHHHVPRRLDQEFRAQRERSLSVLRNEQWIYL